MKWRKKKERQNSSWGAASDTLYNQRALPSSQLHSRGRTKISFFKTNRIGSSSQTIRSASSMKLMLLRSDSRRRHYWEAIMRSWKWHMHTAMTSSQLTCRWSTRRTSFSKTNWRGSVCHTMISAKGMTLMSSLSDRRLPSVTGWLRKSTISCKTSWRRRDVMRDSWRS